MSRLTLDDLVTTVQAFLPNSEEAQVKAAANLFLRRIARRNLSFTKARLTITTTAPVTATVTVSEGGVTVTCATAAASWEGQVVLIPGSDQWFSITSVSVGVSFVISSAFDGADVAGGSATIAFPRIAVDADLVSISELKSPGESPLSLVANDLYSLLGNDAQLGKPTSYFLLEQKNAADSLEIFLVDYPDNVYTFTLIGRERLTRFAGTTSLCGLPERYEDVLLAGTLFYLIAGDDPKSDLMLFWKAEMLEGMRDVYRAAAPGGVDLGTIEGADSAGGVLSARFPTEGAS